MKTATRVLAALFSAALACSAVPAQAQRHWGGGERHEYHGGYHRGWGWGPAWGLGIGLGLGYGAGYWNGYYAPYGWGPGYVVVQSPPPVTVVQPPAQTVVPAAPSSTPAPVVYPRNGQSAAQTESDQQDCNRWATTVPGALADASVMMRAVAACMDARGYTLK
ncbi:MAG: hypothetical protein KGL18_16120 [Burkholderiales bacterium]|nr:hypothetical protein [Burkholderiales bacterium]MDE1927227.1 hypothetical protein [Burkholderiales bacterium]MDE2157562.1 hypothetical protein [Burkholderiales bacterium]MDE2504491.1 hypothetical protein [Burkholderiales bacterium]